MAADDETLRRSLVASPQGTEAELRPGQTVGRYLITRHLGSGGSGQVFAAEDSLLQRPVALKVLHRRPTDGDHSTEATQAAWDRLLHEAQAMARLSHPNVVTVHDVVSDGDRVLLSMELIDGVDLTKWLTRAPRHRALVEVLIGAGRGLAAAHAAGLVHRDFKPGNVMVPASGVAKVADFGLSAAAGGEESTSVTADGTTIHAVGTPRYMAPEQHRGARGDARVDVYAFCVTVLEAWWGRAPFSGRDLDALARHKAAGMPAPPPGGRRLPRTLETALRRGLEPDPQQRSKDLEPILTALASTGRPRAAIVAGSAGAIALGAAAAWWGSSQPPSTTTAQTTAGPCDDPQGLLADAYADPHRTQVRAAFDATDEPWARYARNIAMRELDAYAEAWVAAYSAACGSKASGEHTEATFDLVTRCLDDAKAELSAVVAALAEADAALARRSAEEIAALPRIARCADVETLRRRTPMPTDPATAKAIGGVRATLSRVRDLKARGEYPEALTTAQRATQAALAIDYPPIQAEAQYWLGVMQRNTGDDEGAEESLHAAVAAAQVGRHDVLEADSWIYLVHLVEKAGRHDEALRYVRFALAALERLGSPDEATARLLMSEASVHAAMGEYERALQGYRSAREIEVRAYGPDSDRGLLTLNRIGSTQTKLRRFTAALETFEHGLAIATAELGEQHPQTAMLHSNVGAIAAQLGERERALPHYRAALEIRKATLAHDDPDLAHSHHALAVYLLGDDDYDQARHHLDAALGALKNRYGADHVRLVPLHNELCAVWYYLDNLDEAVRQCERARDISRAADPVPARGLYDSLNRLAIIARKREQPQAAVGLRREARAAGESAWGPSAAELAEALLGEARVLLDLDRHAEAKPLLLRALALRTRDGDPHRQSARNRLLLALAVEPDDPAAAAEHARLAWTLAVDTGNADVERTAAKWLADHGLAPPKR